MKLKEIIKQAFEEGKIVIEDIGTFKRRDVIHTKTVGNNTTKPFSTVTFELNKKLRK